MTSPVVWEAWDEIALAVTGALETFSTPVVRFFAGDGVRENNALLADLAFEILEDRASFGPNEDPETNQAA